MWLVRLARALKLKSITQKSSAEYHSQRNLVKRVHAAQNHALSNEQFSSRGIYLQYEKGDEKHKANMEHIWPRKEVSSQHAIVERYVPLCAESADKKISYLTMKNIW